MGSLQFTTGVSPVVSKMFVYAGNSLKICYDNQGVIAVPVVPLPVNCYHGLSYIERADIIRDKSTTKGLQITLSLQGSGKS